MTCSSSALTSSIRWVDRMIVRGCSREVLEQTVVEDLAGDRVEAEVRLVEEGQWCAGGETDDDSDGGELAAGELLDPAVQRHAEFRDQTVGEVGIPVLEEPGRAREHMLGPEVFGVRLALFDEADLAEHRGVLDGGLAETRMSPVLANCCPVRSCIMVVLPAPLRPSSP